jgi:hypothetical protein
MMLEAQIASQIFQTVLSEAQRDQAKPLWNQRQQRRRQTQGGQQGLRPSEPLRHTPYAPAFGREPHVGVGRHPWTTGAYGPRTRDKCRG